MAVAALFGSASMAQVSVTFQVDMNGETVSPNGVHVAGSWQDDAGFGDEWQPNTSPMTDVDTDGIYELTVSVPAGDYEYKFINDNAWGADESVPAVNQRGGGNSNRVFVVSAWHGDVANLPDGYVLPAVAFAGSAPAGQVALRLQIDMTNQTVGDLGVHVAGNFSTPNWTPQLSKAWPIENGKYAFVANVPTTAAYSYKFLNGDFWGTDESVPAECATDDNRFVAIGDVDVTTESFCFGTCGPCAVPSDVTLTVDMSNVGTLAPEVYAAGTFNGYSDQAMTDNGDGTYSLVLPLDPGSYFFKFKNGPDGWESVPPECQGEGSADRSFTVLEGEIQTVASCFQQCAEVCVANPDQAEITFSVDMNAETVSPDGVFLISSFTTPAYQDGAIEMTDVDADGIYEVTTAVDGSPDIQFKFVNGDVFEQTNEESADFAEGGCGSPNGIGGFNRTHTRSGEPEALGYVFNSCLSILSTTEAELGRVAIYPNPSEGVSFLEVENPNNHTLRMNIVDITGKVVTESMLINTTRYEINTTNLNSGLYFLNIVNERSDRAVYKLMVQ